MKKFFAIMMALVLVFALSVTAFAAEGTGSVTITNATKNHEYSLYKIFDAKIATGADGKTTSVSYSITPDNQFFSYLFGTDGKTANDYFDYNATTGAVSLNSAIDTAAEETQMFGYLKTMVESGTFETTGDPITASGATVQFTGVPYGYYLIYKDNTSAVTVDSNTPNVEVIDKNQEAGNFVKDIWDKDEEKWTNVISSNVGDTEKFKIEFTATNYNGEFPVKYYTVKDTNGSALAIDYTNFTVKVGDTTLTNGYYYDGTAGNVTKTDAQYYIVRNGDSFEIVIPWMSNHTFTGTVTGNVAGYTLTYGTDSAPALIYGATETVVIEYTATVEENADIAGANGNENNKNTAHVEWYYSNTNGTTGNDVTDIYVYAMGVEKIDADTKNTENVKHLAGAQFEIYRDKDCTVPVNVKTTNTTGVYILDAAGSSNTVETGDSGKIAIIGLKEGTYYLKEIKAPDGYNVMEGTTKVEVDADSVSEEAFLTYNATVVTVENSKGTELPSTGGMGTMMLITIGTIIAMAFAVLLITHKKMSVYHD